MCRVHFSKPSPFCPPSCRKMANILSRSVAVRISHLISAGCHNNHWDENILVFIQNDLQSSAGASDRSLGRAAASIVGRIFHWPHSNIASSVLPTGFSTCQLKLNELRNISVRIWTNWFKVSGGRLSQNRFWQEVLHCNWATAQNALMCVRYQ